MLWWGMDETLVELFVQHPLASNFIGNPLDEFLASIGGSEHGPDKTPGSIGLYCVWYNVVVSPGEYGRSAC